MFLTKELEDSLLDFEETPDGIVVIKDFVSKDEIDHIFSIINKTPDADWRIEYLGNLAKFCMMKFGRDDVDNLVAEGKYEITQNWEDKNLNILTDPLQRVIYNRLNDLIVKTKSNLELSGLATIQRMQEGVELKSHTDQHTDPSISYATILYLNDDYVDGELFFENKGLQLRPAPGTLLIFAGGEDFKHGVRHVGAGPIRYVIVGFIKSVDFYEGNKY